MHTELSGLQELIEELTVEFVNIKSINSTRGEVNIAEAVEEKVRTFPYFKKRPERTWTKTVENDVLGRKSVFALLKGKGGTSNRTIILHSHTDTVTIDDYGELKGAALHPYELMKKMKNMNLSADVRKDLHSEDWLFGRGSVDMKSGIAVQLWVLYYFSEHPEELSGNLLFMTNPIEENTHAGIIDALSELERLQEEKNCEFVTAVNSDFTGPLFPEDETRYLYLGAVGKLLPCFYIRGKETHVGQAYEGLNPDLIASELVRQIDSNASLADTAMGEMTQPPSVLKSTDLKSVYNVQTPISAFVYFNYFVHGRSPDRVLDQLSKVATGAFEDVIEHLNNQYSRFCRQAEFIWTRLPWKSNVITYEQLYQTMKNEHGKIVDNRLAQVLRESSKRDERDRGRLMVETLLSLSSNNDPVIVLFFAPPYCPRNYVKGETNEEKRLLESLQAVTAGFPDPFESKYFFPFLTDSSYLNTDDTVEEINALKNNFPGMETLYPVPVDKIRRLNIPSVNIGTWGKDAHKMTERVYKPYTFYTLPLLIKQFCKQMLT